MIDVFLFLTYYFRNLFVVVRRLSTTLFPSSIISFCIQFELMKLNFCKNIKHKFPLTLHFIFTGELFYSTIRTKKVHTLEFRIKLKEILLFSRCFCLLNILTIRDFLFTKSPPVFLIFKQKFPTTLLFGTPVIFGTKYSFESTNLLIY